MAEHSGVTLAELFPEPFENIGSVARDGMTRNAEVGRQNLAWEFVGSQAESALRSVVDYDIFELVAHGWCVARELYEYTDVARHPKGEVNVVRFGEHGLTRDVHPVLKIMFGNIELEELRFRLELTANFRAVALSILDGNIVAAQPGDAYVSATLKYGGVKLHRKESRKVQVPGRVTFAAPGLPITR